MAMTPITTIGREFLREALPDKYKQWADKQLDKKTLVAMTTAMAKDDPDTYIQTLQNLNRLGEDIVSVYGNDAALSFRDSAPSSKLLAVNKNLRDRVSAIMNDSGKSAEQKEKAIIDLGYAFTQKIQDAVFEDQDSKKTALASQLNSGSRGSKTQLMQLLFGNMLMKDALGRDIPFLHMDPYTMGTTPMAFWVSASSGRKGMYDVQAATANSGYLGKQVTLVTHDVVIEKDDCGTTDTGVPFKAADPQNVGRVLLRPFHKHSAGSVVTPEMVAEADDDEEMIVRTPMTCKCATGVCAKCNGLAESGRFPGIGDYVALNSARTFVEKITQASVGSKHGAGLAGKRVEDPDGPDQPSGFKNIERMFKVPDNFPGHAVLSPVSGTVSGIQAAPQGGSYVIVGTQRLYCSPERTFSVHTGDHVDAGDALTNGVPNPTEVVRYKGLGAGRLYYMKKLTDVFKKEGFGVDRNNLESFSRAMINKVRITDPDGYRAWLPGDIASYSEIAAEWKPRESSEHKAPGKAINAYLDAPVLSYSIGTPVTAAVAKDLVSHGFNDIIVNNNPPPFEPEFLRPATALQYDKNWLPRLSGERLYDSIFDAAQKGITDKYDSTSYVDRIVAAPFK